MRCYFGGRAGRGARGQQRSPPLWALALVEAPRQLTTPRHVLSRSTHNCKKNYHGMEMLSPWCTKSRHRLYMHCVLRPARAGKGEQLRPALQPSACSSPTAQRYPVQSDHPAAYGKLTRALLSLCPPCPVSLSMSDVTFQTVEVGFG